eukprot:TRINITY_DN16533_c0_g1_i3.p1 TRINITY_DN16533_c0_g1~~TRINITY_DN16533_c0_g1_i3.p1  ORF type:complete len:236 (+),score=35.00 TRINITY_DN16533_c0_g1_i3:199-906(+)
MEKVEKKCILIAGPPAAGKGTQAKIIEDKYGYKHMSTGDLLRNEIKKGNALASQLKGYFAAKMPIPDSFMNMIIEESLKRPDLHKLLLDGFPRTIDQAKKLEEILFSQKQELEHMILLEADEATVLDRSLGRMIHLPSGRTYHTKYSPPKEKGKDDITGEPLTHRRDDEEIYVRKRFASYREAFGPIIEFYASKGLLIKIDATKSIEEVWTQIQNIFEQTNPPKLDTQFLSLIHI